jgi:hypothetical protein
VNAFGKVWRPHQKTIVGNSARVPCVVEHFVSRRTAISVLIALAGASFQMNPAIADAAMHPIFSVGHLAAFVPSHFPSPKITIASCYSVRQAVKSRHERTLRKLSPRKEIPRQRCDARTDTLRP